MLHLSLFCLISLVAAVQQELLRQYDYVIVGSGSSGSVVANRLSKDFNTEVLLLEAGLLPNLISETVCCPAQLRKTEYDWQYEITAQKDSFWGYKNRRISWPRGKVLGGTSILNYMMYVRGNRRDFDEWAENGSSGWSYDEILPYFKKSEDNRIPGINESYYHSTGGELSIDKSTFQNPLQKLFLEAAEELGYPIADYNGAFQRAFFDAQATIENGKRCSTKKAFLDPIMGRRNLHILTSAFVTKINFDHDKRATGVTFDYKGERRTVSVRREVIVSAGAINSPQLLMLSGVGPKEELEKFHIPVVSDLPVGKNLQDHVLTLSMIATVESPYTLKKSRITVDALFSYLKDNKGIMSTVAGLAAIGFVNTEYNKIKDWPDIELILSIGTLASDGESVLSSGLSQEIVREYLYPYIDNDTIVCVPILQRPKSRGEIRLNSTDPYVYPIIDPKYFSDKDDLKILGGGMKICQRLFATSSMKKVNTKLIETIVPGCEKYEQFSDEYMMCVAQIMTQSTYHQVGTCKMGSASDQSAVVDPRLRVKRVKGLRVVDASIMPTVITGHTNAACIMIGEKGSDMILEDFESSGCEEEI